ncbi:hypothetical protein HETIRDRAFT_244249, partial [Heterobasidion irregulare TC 32-1]
RRIWAELVGVVGWMHQRGVVHRDLKLENILLTTNPLLPPAPAPAPASAVAPLVKLTDFGLARAIDPRDPWLTTRCGSESYAAPELLAAGTYGGTYDGRETDAWALGVVLFAL